MPNLEDNFRTSSPISAKHQGGYEELEAHLIAQKGSPSTVRLRISGLTTSQSPVRSAINSTSFTEQKLEWPEKDRQKTDTNTISENSPNAWLTWIAQVTSIKIELTVIHTEGETKKARHELWEGTKMLGGDKNAILLQHLKHTYLIRNLIGLN